VLYYRKGERFAEVYLEEDGTYFHDIYYKEDKPDSSDIAAQQN